MNYAAMSDSEINARVAQMIHGDQFWRCPNYSADMNEAMEVVGWIRKTYDHIVTFGFIVNNEADGNWKAFYSYRLGHGGTSGFSAKASTAPRAIREAALMAHEAMTVKA